MSKTKIREYIVAALVGSIVTAICVWSLYSRETNGPRSVVNNTDKIQIYSAAGDTYTVSNIKFVDKDGNAVITIHAGPPPTIDIVDERGRTKSIDLRKLASKASWFGDPNE